MLLAVQTGEGVFGATSYLTADLFDNELAAPPGPEARSKVQYLSRGLYRREVPVFGDQKGRGVGRVESKRRLP